MASKGQMTGMTGVYLVAAKLSQLGFIASPTSRSARGADILVTDIDCKKAFSIQVKTNAKRAKFWLLNEKATEMVSPSHLYVLVNLCDDGPEFFVVPSEEIARKMEVARHPKTTWYSVHLKNIKQFKDQWNLLSKKEE